MRTPSFVGLVIKFSLPILLPVLFADLLADVAWLKV